MGPGTARVAGVLGLGDDTQDWRRCYAVWR